MVAYGGKSAAPARDICQRATEYSLRAIQLYRHLAGNRDVVCQVIGRQFLRSATSIGANLVEAQSGESRKDFIHKYSIAQKEAKETKYWLTLMIEAQLVADERLNDLMQETCELIAIITSIIVKAKKRLV